MPFVSESKSLLAFEALHSSLIRATEIGNFLTDRLDNGIVNEVGALDSYSSGCSLGNLRERHVGSRGGHESASGLLCLTGAIATHRAAPHAPPSTSTCAAPLWSMRGEHLLEAADSAIAHTNRLSTTLLLLLWCCWWFGWRGLLLLLLLLLVVRRYHIAVVFRRWWWI